MEGTCLIQEAGHLMKDEKLSQNLDVVASLRPHWSEDLAGRLMDAYELQRARLSTPCRAASGRPSLWWLGWPREHP